MFENEIARVGNKRGEVMFNRGTKKMILIDAFKYPVFMENSSRDSSVGNVTRPRAA